MPSNTLFVIEHSRGTVCCRLRKAGRNRVALCPKHLPYAQVELELGTQARIQGIVDLEIRPLANLELPEVPSSLGRFWTPAPLKPNVPFRSVGEWIRSARRRSELSFREASERTRRIARVLHHPGYFCAAGTLSDYETSTLPPRHIHKLISLCAVYCVAAADLLNLAGLRLENAGGHVMPDELLGRSRVKFVEATMRPSYLLKEIEGRFDEVPYFLRNALPALLGLPNLSVRDIFWTGTTQQGTHPFLQGTAFLVVDRKRRVPRSSLSFPLWAQPLYVLQTRDGNYLYAACTLQNHTLVVRPCVAASRNLMRLRNRVDAEVIGKVVAIVRRLTDAS